MWMCVECGKEANKGSMRHPYCSPCYERVWKDDDKKFLDWLENGHNYGFPPNFSAKDFSWKNVFLNLLNTKLW